MHKTVPAAAAIAIAIFAVGCKPDPAPTAAKTEKQARLPGEGQSKDEEVMDISRMKASQGGMDMSPEARMAEMKKADEMIAKEKAKAEANFAAEGKGDAAAKLEAGMKDVLATKEVKESQFKPKKVEMECKDTQCRIVANFDPRNPPDDFAMRSTLGSAKLFEASRRMTFNQPGGGSQLVMYFYPKSTDPRLR